MSKNKPVYAFVRKGNSLIPEMEMDYKLLKSIPENKRVIVDIKNGRNAGRHRAYWLMLHACIEATECASNVKVLHNAVKLHTKLIEYVRLKNGETIAVPSSIAFEKLNEEGMIEHFQAAEKWLAEEYGFVWESKEMDNA